MRDIEFRGKSKNLGWVHGNLFIPDKGYERLEICFGSSACRITCEVDPESVGQYIGKKDKNGNKIYEGDILKFADEIFEKWFTDCGYEYSSSTNDNYAVVGYDEEKARFDFVRYKYENGQIEADLHENHDLDFGEFVSELEVIGNIHDNPELMEEK